MHPRIAILLSCFVTNTLSSSGASTCNNDVLAEEESAAMPENKPEKRLLTLSLAEKVKVLPYDLPHDLLQSISHRDACTLLGSVEGWPDNFTPGMENCQLCGSPLGDAAVHSSEASQTFGHANANFSVFLTV